MNTVLTWLYVGGVVLLLFGAAVFVHEWGHYIVARLRGLKVEAFAIGFGPKIFGWRKNGIEYSWRAIPAGGYVKIPQMITSEALEGKYNDADGKPLPPADALSKILVAFAGPFMNLVFAFVIAGFLYFVGLPVLIDPSVIGYVDPASAEGKIGIREGDRIVMVDGKPTKSWHDVQMATIFASGTEIPVVIERDGMTNSYTLEAKFNDVIGGKFLSLDSKDHPALTAIMDGPAKEAGLKEGDKVLTFADVTISGVKQFQNLIKERGGQPTPIEVERDGKRMAFTVTPVGEKGSGLLKVGLGSGAKLVYTVQKPGPAPFAAIKDVVNKTFATLDAVIFRSKETGVGAKDLSGPVGIFALLAHAVSVDYRLALDFLVLLNINLAILNLLPVPVLDGGHIVMALIEKVMRRPLPVKVLEYATTVFALLLIGFMLFVSYHDVNRFSLFRSMFDQQSEIGSDGPGNAETALPPAKSEVPAE